MKTNTFIYSREREGFVEYDAIMILVRSANSYRVLNRNKYSKVFM